MSNTTSVVTKFWMVLVATVVFVGCVETDDEWYYHKFDITYMGSPAASSAYEGGPLYKLFFTAESGDFPYWPSGTEGVGWPPGMEPIDALLPGISIEIGELDMYKDDQICLTGPMKLFDPVTLEQVYEIPTGTCFENDGETVLVIDG